MVFTSGNQFYQVTNRIVIFYIKILFVFILNIILV